MKTIKKIKQILLTSFFSLLLLTVMNNCAYAQSDTWAQKTDYPGGGRQFPSGFSIGSKGYVGTGFDQFGGPSKDFWEYDPTSGVWTQLSDFGGSPRWAAASFSVGGKGYIGTGRDNNVN